MLNTEHEIRHQVVSEILATGRLISEVAEEYGIPNKRVYEWIKLSKKPSKRGTSQRKSKLKVKVQQLSEELKQLELAS